MKFFINLDRCRKAYPDIELDLDSCGVLVLTCQSPKSSKKMQLRWLEFLAKFKADNPDLLINESSILEDGKVWLASIAFEIDAEFFEKKDSQNDSADKPCKTK